MADDLHRMKWPATSVVVHNATLLVAVLVAVAVALFAVDAASQAAVSLLD